MSLFSPNRVVATQNFNAHEVTAAELNMVGGNYSPGDILGDKETLAEFAGTKAARIDSIVIRNIDNLTPNLKIFIFSDNPATAFADNAPFNPSVADLHLIAAVVEIESADWISFGVTNTRHAAVKNNLNLVVFNGGTAYLVVTTVGSITGSSAQALSLTIGTTKDA